MTTSLLTAIANIVTEPIRELEDVYKGRNRANNMGVALEEYIKDAFAGTINETNEQIRLSKLAQTFSYIGNQNNPPDMMLRSGDAIEVKKIESHGAQLALNSSYPKAKLFSDNPMITASCRCCEEWTEKDIIFAVGVINQKILKKLYFVYGIDYAASAEIYERIKVTIMDGIETIPGVEFSETKELGRVNRIDPLGITHLRIRGMWGIKNPANVFSYIIQSSGNAEFELVAIINTDRYNAFSKKERSLIEELAKTKKGLRIDNVEIKTPDNPAALRSAKIISYRE